MMNKLEHKLKNLPETMLIPLWAKAIEGRNTAPFLRDECAEEMVERIDYDWSKFKRSSFSLTGCALRASLIDEEVRRFLAKHPEAVVIQLGAGLDARYQRLGCPEITHWYDLDLEESIRLREQLLPPTERNTYLTQSLFDYSWIDLVKEHGKPVMVVVEGVLMYFEEQEVRAFFKKLCEELEELTIVFDMLAYALVKRSRQHDAVATVSGVEFLWSELWSSNLEAWHPKIHLAHEYYMSDYDRGRYPWIFRMLYKIPYFYRRFNQRVVTLAIHN